MKLYNTLTKQLEDFKPLQEGKVKFYHCGPTVYWTQHIGNLRGMAMGDLVRRSLMYTGYEVDYVRNYTDVGHLTSDADEGEDKMEKGAKREGLTPDEIADKYIKIFEEDVAKLNLIEPTHKSKVTSCIQEIIDMVQILLDKNAAYITPKAVYFDVTKAEDYPAFSKRKLEDQQEGAGSGDVTDDNKRHPADFALWFFKTGAHKNAMQTWESPFESSEVENGRGFPGWHIECSVIAHKFLGQPLDIHMGGVEHISIHHPNEIAQSEAAFDEQFANYWLHNEHLTVDGEKMSKSQGTGFSLQEIEEKGFDPMDLRYFYLQAHYRSKQNFTWEAIEAARTARERLITKTLKTKEDSSDEINEEWKAKFVEALSEDVNVAKALAVVWDMLKEADEKTYATLLDFDKVLGLNLQSSFDKATGDKQISDLNPEIQNLIQEREEARDAKDFARADEIRDEIREKHGVEIKDTEEGTEIITK